MKRKPPIIPKYIQTSSINISIALNLLNSLKYQLSFLIGLQPSLVDLFSYLPKAPTGIKNEPIIPPMMIRNLIAQNPFCIPALGSFELLTRIIRSENSRKNSVTMKQSLK